MACVSKRFQSAAEDCGKSAIYLLAQFFRSSYTCVYENIHVQVFLLLGVLLIAAARPTSANLIVNGDFETGTLAGWTTAPAATGSNFGVSALPPAHDTLGAFFSANGSDLTQRTKPLPLPRGLPTDVSFFYQPVSPSSPQTTDFVALFNGVAIYENFNSISGFIFQTFTVQATGSLTTLEFQGRNAVLGGVDYLDDVSVTPTQSGVRGSGYWANHPEAWCFSNITLGCQSYTQAAAIAIMQHPTHGDMTYQLAAQLAAAKLNTDCAGMDSSCVASAILVADAWLCSHPIGSNVRANSQAWKEITATFNTLADYNNGELCAPPG